MGPVQKTGLYYPNKFGLIIIKSLEEVMGKNGLNAILNLGGLNNYIENYPPDNLDKGFDFAELSAIGIADKFTLVDKKCQANCPNNKPFIIHKCKYQHAKII